MLKKPPPLAGFFSFFRQVKDLTNNGVLFDRVALPMAGLSGYQRIKRIKLKMERMLVRVSRDKGQGSRGKFSAKGGSRHKAGQVAGYKFQVMRVGRWI